MKTALPLHIKPQPDEITCGPTCLQSLYKYYGDPISLEQVIREVPQLEEGGTFGALLACHALRRGYRVTIYSYNLHLFDPTWFGHEGFYIRHKLEQQRELKQDPKFQAATDAYIEFLDLGGKLSFEVLRPALIQHYLDQDLPIICGLSATFLYSSMREYGPDLDYDDLRGEPSGHFVILNGYDADKKLVSVADPIRDNPLGKGQVYDLDADRVINAILLGIITYDANLIIIRPE